MATVFLSSVMAGMEAMRRAAEAACESLGIKVIKAEDFVADPASPRGACLRGVANADGFLLLLGSRYGSRLPNGLSATHEEFVEAGRLRKELFLFRTSEDIEPDQQQFLKAVGEWQGGHFYKTCLTPADLQRDVVKALLAWRSAPATAEVDASVATNLDRVTPSSSLGTMNHSDPWLAVSWAPNQRVTLDDSLIFEDLPEAVVDALVAGPSRLVSTRPRTGPQEHGLAIQNANQERPELRGWVGVDGSIAIGVELMPTQDRRADSYMAPMFFLSPRDLSGVLSRQLAFIGAVLGKVDPDLQCIAGRLQVRLARMGMRTIGEPSPGQNSFSMGVGGGRDRDKPTTVPSKPATVIRSHLQARSPEVAALVKRLQRLADAEPGSVE